MFIKNTKQSFVCHIGSILYFSYHKHIFWKDQNQQHSFSNRSQIYTYISTEG